MTREEYIRSVKASFVTLSTSALTNYLMAQMPFLRPIKIIIEYFSNKLFSFIVNQMETAIFFEYVDFRVSEQGNNLTLAALEFDRIQASGTKEEKDEAEKKLIAAFTDFVRLNHY